MVVAYYTHSVKQAVTPVYFFPVVTGWITFYAPTKVYILKF